MGQLTSSVYGVVFTSASSASQMKSTPGEPWIGPLGIRFVGPGWGWNGPSPASISFKPSHLSCSTGSIQVSKVCDAGFIDSFKLAPKTANNQANKRVFQYWWVEQGKIPCKPFKRPASPLDKMVDRQLYSGVESGPFYWAVWAVVRPSMMTQNPKESWMSKIHVLGQL